jgi:hypothetical protein
MWRTVFSWPSEGFFRHPIVSTVCFELVLLVAFGLIGYSNPGNLRTPLRSPCATFFPLLGLGLVLWIVAAFAPAAGREPTSRPITSRISRLRRILLLSPDTARI